MNKEFSFYSVSIYTALNVPEPFSNLSSQSTPSNLKPPPGFERIPRPRKRKI